METNLLNEVKSMMSPDETVEASENAEAESKPKKSKKKGKKEVKKLSKKEDKKSVKTKKAAPSEDGSVKLAELAEEAGMTPAAARRKLRDAEVDRGEGRWSWKEGSSELKKVSKVLGLA